MLKTYLTKNLIYILLIFLIGISSTAANEDINGGQIKITEVVKSSFLSPGDKNAELQLIMNNDMDSSLSNVKVYLFITSPFTVSIDPNNQINEMNYPGYLIGPGDSEYVPYFEVGAKQGRTVRFKIDVEKSGKYGNYDLPYAIYYDGKVINGKFTVRVSGSTLVGITDVLTTPGSIVSGDDFEINFNIKNSGENTIKWIKVDVSAEDNKIIPIFSTTERVFTDVVRNDIRQASYRFSTDRKTVPKNYPLRVALTYQDESGVLYNETELIGIKVLGKANLEIGSIKIEPERVVQGEPFTLTIRIENNGQGDARSVESEVDIPITGGKTAFLGKIAPDEDAPAMYILKADKNDKLEYNLTIYYSDDLGIHKKVQQMSLLVYPRDNNSTFLFGGFVIAVVLGYMFMQSRRGV